MKEYAQQSRSKSRTLESNPKASRQAPIDVILQQYKARSIQRYTEDEELIQGKGQSIMRMQGGDRNDNEEFKKETNERGQGIFNPFDYLPIQSKSRNIIQRKLNAGGIEDIKESEGDIGLQTLIQDDRLWKFRTLNEAKSVGKMVNTMKTSILAGQYAQKNETQLGLNTNLHNTLKHFRDPDHPAPPHDSKGKYSQPFDIAAPDEYTTLLNTPDIQDDTPTLGRINEALVTAIKLKSMNHLTGNHKLYSTQAIDYILEDENEKQYGFDPFELPKSELGEPLLNDEDIDTWLEDAYDKHVRTKKGNVGKEGKSAYYSGLLDVSRLTVEQLNKVLNKIYDYEEIQSTNPGYEVPHLSLINSWLTENNVADFEFPQEFDIPEFEGFGDLFGDT